MSWPVKTIQDVAELVTKGTTPTTLGKAFTDSGIRFIKAEALNGDTSLEDSGMAFIDEDTHKLLKRSVLNVDDILITIAGAQIGRCGFVRERNIPANTNQAVGIVRINKAKAFPRFVYYFFKQKTTFEFIQNLGAAQAAQPNLNLANLKKIKFRTPLLDEQKKISDFLSAYDDLIENNTRQIQLLEEAARQFYKEWFVRLRFPGHEQAKIVDGVPLGWVSKPLGEITRINHFSLEKSFDGLIRYIDIASVSSGSINETKLLDFRDAPGRARRIVRHGDVIWSCVRPNIRAHAVIWNPGENLIASTGFAVITPVDLPTSFIYQAVTTDQFVGYLENNAKGAAYPAVVASDFERAIVLVPPDSLVKEFDDFAMPCQSQIYNLRSQNV